MRKPDLFAARAVLAGSLVQNKARSTLSLIMERRMPGTSSVTATANSAHARNTAAVAGTRCPAHASA